LSHCIVPGHSLQIQESQRPLSQSTCIKLWKFALGSPRVQFLALFFDVIMLSWLNGDVKSMCQTEGAMDFGHSDRQYVYLLLVHSIFLSSSSESLLSVILRLELR